MDSILFSTLQVHACEKDPGTDSDSDSGKGPEQTNMASAEIGISYQKLI